MNFLDMRTLVFSNVVTDILCLLVILLLWRQSRKRFAGTGFWVFDFTFQTTAMFLVILRGNIPDWMSMVLSNTLVIGGAILGYIGLGRFVGKKTWQVHNYALLAVFACVHAHFTLVQPNLAARNLNLSVGLLIICFQCMWLLVWRVEPGMRPLTLGVGMVFGVYCLVSIARIVGFLSGTRTTIDYFRSSAFESLVLLSYQLLFILLTYSLALMVSKRLLVEVKTQEEKFAKAFQSSPYAITLTRLSDGQIIEVNDGFSNISGYQYAEAIGKTTHDLHLWDKEEDRVAAVNELSKSGKVRGREFQFRKKTGEKITGLFSAGFIPINNQEFVLSSISDITERKKAEEALRESEERWATTLASIGDAVISTDVEGRVTFMNAVAEALTGWRLAEASTRPVAEVFKVINEQTRREVENPVARVLLEGKIIGLANHTLLVRKDGTEVAIDDSGAPLRDNSGNISGIVLVFRDITERKRAEEALRQNEARRQVAEAVEAERQRLYDVLETLPAMICLLTPDYHVVFANRSFREKFGESNGRHCYEYCFGRTEPCEFCESYHVLKTGKPHHWEVIGPEESVIDAYDFPFTDVDGSPLILEMDIDITERKQTEQALRESESRLRNLSSQLLIAQEQERKRIAGELHDSIAATLGAIKFSIENTLGQMEQDSAASESLKGLVSLTQQANEETRRIMADLRPGILDDLGVIAALGWFCREFQKRYFHLHVERQIDLNEEEIPESLKTPVFRISQEALNNVAKHSGADLVQLSMKKMENGIELTIKDNGQGFDPIANGPDREPGKKLGLTSMRERAQLSGGSFALESAMGKGTIIRVSWPST